MDKHSYINTINNYTINSNRVEQVKKKYNAEFNDFIAKIISFASPDNFIDEEKRILYFDEIINPSKYLNVDFTTKKLLPIIDAFDNNIIVYNLEKNNWCKFNTVDEIIFKEKENLIELL